MRRSEEEPSISIGGLPQESLFDDFGHRAGVLDSLPAAVNSARASEPEQSSEEVPYDHNT